MTHSKGKLFAESTYFPSMVDKRCSFFFSQTIGKKRIQGKGGAGWVYYGSDTFGGSHENSPMGIQHKSGGGLRKSGWAVAQADIAGGFMAVDYRQRHVLSCPKEPLLLLIIRGRTGSAALPARAPLLLGSAAAINGERGGASCEGGGGIGNDRI